MISNIITLNENNIYLIHPLSIVEMIFFILKLTMAATADKSLIKDILYIIPCRLLTLIDFDD